MCRYSWDQTHWTLDVGKTAGASGYQDVRDVCLFIPDGNLLDNNSALVGLALFALFCSQNTS